MTIEEAILGEVTRRRVRASDLMNDAHRIGFPSGDIRETVWVMLDRGTLGLTPDRYLFEGGSDVRPAGG